MAVIGTGVDTLANWAKGRDPNGPAADIVEMLSQANEMIPIIRWKEGNLPLGNRTSIRVALPTVSTRQIGQGVATSTSRYAQFDDGCAIIEAWNEVDCLLAELEGDVGQYRFLQALPYFEAMSQKYAFLFWYGDSTFDTTQFFGMSARYATKTAANAANAVNVIDGGGTASVNASLWLIYHGGRGCQGIVPKGSKAGLQHDDLGKIRSQVVVGYPTAQSLLVYADRYQWIAGLATPDWRWNVRICNVDVNNLVAEAGAADLLKLMTKATFRVPTGGNPAYTSGNPKSNLAAGMGTPYWHCNRTIAEMLEIQAENKINPQLKMADIGSQKMLTYKNIPFVISDQLSNAEAEVV